MSDVLCENRLVVDAPARWGLGGTVLWGLLVGFVSVVAQSGAMFAVVLLRTRPSGQDLPQAIAAAAGDGFVLALAVLASAIAGTAVVVGSVLAKKGATLRDHLALEPAPAKAYFVWLGVLLAYLAATSALAWAVHHESPDFMVRAYRSARPVWVLWVAVIVGAPVFEEVFFRGLLLRGAEGTRLGQYGGVVITAALWALVHLQYAAFEMGIIFGLGLLFGAARVVTGSLYVPLALHALNNLAAIGEAALGK